MALQHPTKLYTAEEFEQLIGLPENTDRLLELINGEIAEKMPTQEHGEITGEIFAFVRDFVRPRKLGRVGVEVRHKIPDDDANSRLPDVSFVAGNKPRLKEGGVPQMPDLAVEVKSPNDSFKRMREKARYYLAHGSRMVWLVFPDEKVVEIYTLDDEFVLGENGIIDGGDVLPGFKLPVHEIFLDPMA